MRATQGPDPRAKGEIRAAEGGFPAPGEVWPLTCTPARELNERPGMTVPTRYILAAAAFAVAALGLWLLPADARADCNRCGPPPPPPCQTNCGGPPPCHSCQPPTIIVPPPHVPPPNIVVVNGGARASAQASATAIAVANAGAGSDTIIRQNYVAFGGGSSSVQSAAFSVTEMAAYVEETSVERMLLIQAICIDDRGNPHPASQTFAGRDVGSTYSGEIYRCMAGTHMRVTMDGRSLDCAPGQALWYEGDKVECRTQIARRPCNERSLLRRFGPGDKMVRLRDTERREGQRETTFSGQMTMDGGVGQSVW